MSPTPDAPPIKVDTYSDLLQFVDCAFEKTKRMMLEEADPQEKKELQKLFAVEALQDRFKLLVTYKTMLAREAMESDSSKVDMTVHCLNLRDLLRQTVLELM